MSIDVMKEPSGTIFIEGPPAGVIAAQTELSGTVLKLQDEISVEVAIEQRLHSLIIGKSGGGINEVCTVFLQSYATTSTGNLHVFGSLSFDRYVHLFL